MKFCEKCGTAVDEKEAHCTNCGRMIPTEKEIKKPFCNNCGANLSEEAKSCTNCGESV